MQAYLLTILINAFALFLAERLDQRTLTILSAALVQLADTLATIAVAEAENDISPCAQPENEQ